MDAAFASNHETELRTELTNVDDQIQSLERKRLSLLRTIKVYDDEHYQMSKKVEGMRLLQLLLPSQREAEQPRMGMPNCADCVCQYYNKESSPVTVECNFCGKITPPYDEVSIFGDDDSVDAMWLKTLFRTNHWERKCVLYLSIALVEPGVQVFKVKIPVPFVPRGREDDKS